MAKRSETTILVLALLITGVLAGASFWLLRKITAPDRPAHQGSIADRISLGSKLLIIANASEAKQAGIKAFAKADYGTAIAQLTAALQNNRNDPETLIYLNNARLLQDSQSMIKVAVSVPIGSNLNVAQEILRGVAQAQDEVNRRGQQPLAVAIANDDNDPEIAEQVATEFVKDSSILAVIGHNSSDASIAAAPIYQRGQLPMITPTSSADTLSGIGSYIYRVVPSTRFTANILSRYVLKTLRKTSVAICLDAKSPDSQSFADNFISALAADGGRFINIACDFTAPDFNANTIISKAVSSGAEALLLAPQVDRLDSAIDIARTNRGRLLLLGNQTLYTINTLKLGQAEMNGLLLPASWHPNVVAGNSFVGNATKYWGGRVNWRTAMAYDAVQTVLTGLQQNTSREGLQKALSNPAFSAKGATGTIQFLPSRDRNGAALLVRVQLNSQMNDYEFAPVSP